MPQLVGEVATIIFAHGVVRDHGRHLGKARFECGAPLGRVEAAGFALAHPQHIGERTRGGSAVREPRTIELAASRGLSATSFAGACSKPGRPERGARLSGKRRAAPDPATRAAGMNRLRSRVLRSWS